VLDQLTLAHPAAAIDEHHLKAVPHQGAAEHLLFLLSTIEFHRSVTSDSILSEFMMAH
jgi:hypothetical protein